MERTAPPGQSAPPTKLVVSPRCSVGIVCNDPSRRLVWDGVRGDASQLLWPGGAEVGTQEGGLVARLVDFGESGRKRLREARGGRRYPRVEPAGKAFAPYVDSAIR